VEFIVFWWLESGCDENDVVGAVTFKLVGSGQWAVGQSGRGAVVAQCWHLPVASRSAKKYLSPARIIAEGLGLAIWFFPKSPIMGLLWSPGTPGSMILGAHVN
jgi:hypothetical protein